jgi:tetratricopeptide (TPR) repeat protein
LLSMLGETTESEMQDRLAQLVRRSLVNRDGDRYGLHALLRDYGRSELGDGLSNVQDKLIFYIGKYTESYSQVTPEHLDHLEAEIENIFKGLEYTENPEKSENMFQILISISEFLAIRGYWNEQVKIGQIAIKLAKQENSLNFLAAITHNTAITMTNLGYFERANGFLTESLEASSILRDFSGVARSLHQLSILSHFQKNYDKASKYCSESLKIRRSLGNPYEIASSLQVYSTIAFSQGQYNDSIRYCNESLEIGQEIGDLIVVTTSFHQLGIIAHKQEKYDNAEENYNKSLKISRKL